MEINDKVFEFIQKIDSKTQSGLAEIETISNSLDSYVNNCVNRCSEFENKIFQKRKLVNELVKSSLETGENIEQNLNTRSKAAFKQFRIDEEPQAIPGPEEPISQDLSGNFIDYFFDNLGLKLEAEGAAVDKMLLHHEKNIFEIGLNKYNEISGVRFEDDVLLTSLDINGLIENIAGETSLNENIFRQELVERLEKYRDANFADLSFTSNN